MSSRQRIAALTMASVTAVGMCVAIADAPQAVADPCTGAAADAQPLPNQAFQIPSPSRIAPFNRPIGHRPAGANDSAPLPRLGQLPLAIMKPLIPPPMGQVNKSAAVAPVPPRPGAPAAPAPAAAAAPAPVPDAQPAPVP